MADPEYKPGEEYWDSGGGEEGSEVKAVLGLDSDNGLVANTNSLHCKVLIVNYPVVEFYLVLLV